MSHLDSAPVHVTGGGQDPEKRRQIIDGAREVFLARGFDAASMGDIARVAGVSKGTLYVYFENKEDLFAAIVRAKCGETAERAIVFDVNDRDIERTLRRIGITYLKAMIEPEHMATVRIVIAVAEKFPAIGRSFLDSGPCAGVARLARWLDMRVSSGELIIADTEMAAWQFLMNVQSCVVMPILIAGEECPSDDRLDYVVQNAVSSFMASYAPRR